MPTFKDRYYSAPPSTHNIAAQYIFDQGAVITGITNPISGAWRPLIPSDLAATINVSGGMTVNSNPSVAITGNPDVQISNFSVLGDKIDILSGLLAQQSRLTDIQPVSVVNSPYQVGITGILSTSGSLALVGGVSITGESTIAGGTYNFTASGITSGTLTIPAGTKSWSLAVESGSCYMNGTLLNNGTNLNGGGYDGRYLLGNSLTIGCTGGRVLAIWEI